MSDCETYEMSISALVDGELLREELLPTLDHLAACPACQAFYRDVRSLAATLPGEADLLIPSASEEAPEDVWRRIEAATAPELPRTGRVQPWVMRAAAAVLLVAGLWGGLATISALHPQGEPIEVTLGEDRGRMTEERFVDLTVELLRADSRYHQEMFQVLAAVVDKDGRQEAPADKDLPRAERNDESRSERTYS